MSRWQQLTNYAERTLLALVWGFAIAVHLGGVGLCLWGDRSSPLVQLARDVLPMPQLTLLLAWWICGPGAVSKRVVGFPLLLILWSIVWTTATWSLRDNASWLLPVFFLVPLLLTGRLWGYTDWQDGHTQHDTRSPQFSLRLLMGITTLIAAVLGILEWLRPMLSADGSVSVYWGRLVAADSGLWPYEPVNLRRWTMAIALAATCLAPLWWTLRPGLAWPRALVGLVLIASFGAYLGHVGGRSGNESVQLGLSMALLAAVVSLSVLPLRLMNLRIARQHGWLPRWLVVPRSLADRLKTCVTCPEQSP